MDIHSDRILEAFVVAVVLQEEEEEEVVDEVAIFGRHRLLLKRNRRLSLLLSKPPFLHLSQHLCQCRHSPHPLFLQFQPRHNEYRMLSQTGPFPRRFANSAPNAPILSVDFRIRRQLPLLKVEWCSVQNHVKREKSARTRTVSNRTLAPLLTIQLHQKPKNRSRHLWSTPTLVHRTHTHTHPPSRVASALPAHVLVVFIAIHDPNILNHVVSAPRAHEQRVRSSTQRDGYSLPLSIAALARIRLWST